MSDDVRSLLQRAAARAKTPEDRAWVEAKYQELYGRAPADEGVPAMLKREPLDLLDANMQRRQEQQQEPAEKPGLLKRALTSLDGTPVHAFMDRANDAFSGGAWPAITNALGIDTPESRDELARQNPTAASLGTGTGYGASAFYGPAMLTTKALTAGASRVAPELMGKALGKVGMGATSGLLMGGAEGASRTGTVEGALDAAGAGALAGTVTSAVPAGIQAARTKLHEASPWIGRYADAKEAGRLPAAKALPAGREGIIDASRSARDGILARKDVLKGQAQGDYKSAIEPELGKPADVAAIQEGLAKLRAGNIVPATGEVVDEALERQIAALTKKMGDAPDVDSVLILRRSLKQAAGFKNPSPTPDQLAARQLYKAFKQGAQNASPVVKEADAKFAAAKTQEGEVMDTLGVPRGIGGKAANRKAAKELEYLGDDSVPALERQPDLQSLRNMDPGYAEALAQLEAKKALEATRLLTLQPQVRTSINPLLANVPLVNAAAPQVYQWSRGAGRIADQSLRNAQPAAEMTPRLTMSLIDAYLARRKAQQEQK